MYELRRSILPIINHYQARKIAGEWNYYNKIVFKPNHDHTWISPDLCDWEECLRFTKYLNTESRYIWREIIHSSSNREVSYYLLNDFLMMYDSFVMMEKLKLV